MDPITLSPDELLKIIVAAFTLAAGWTVLKNRISSNKKDISLTADIATRAKDAAARAHRRIDDELIARARQQGKEEAQESEVFRRLDNIETKLDKLTTEGCAIGCRPRG